MFRAKNIIGPYLHDSECVLWLHCSQSEYAALMAKSWVSTLESHGGRILFDDTATNLACKIVAPHRAMDAFGCFYLLKDIVQSARGEVRVGRISLGHKNIRVEQSWLTALSLSGGKPNTVTQRLLQRLLSVPGLGDQFALAIALDDLMDLRDETLWGNSMFFLTFDRSELQTLSCADSHIWQSTIRDRAARFAKIAEKRGIVGGPLQNTIVISALGQTQKWPWFPELLPSQFAGVPTPAHPSSANLLTWSRGERQILSIAAQESHPIWTKAAALTQAWEEIFNA